ncbi:hypothetical protein NDU88_005312 [Pleurodeles waltl]|uniref:Uncharacterized protein n=1 Tax=Pleurodeles waltl TaxID=8319 RepID=A0AAV7PF05_PLEWA|nr:hypothetical protein NDU88_005312 [Pleurodeles waltl]
MAADNDGCDLLSSAAHLFCVVVQDLGGHQDESRQFGPLRSACQLRASGSPTVPVTMEPHRRAADAKCTASTILKVDPGRQENTSLTARGVQKMRVYGYIGAVCDLSDVVQGQGLPELQHHAAMLVAGVAMPSIF